MRWHSLVVFLGLLPAILQSQTQSKKPDSETLRSRLDSIARASLVDLPVASASVAILRGDDTLLWTAYGYADLENRVPASPSTVYHIGSITKQFTAAAILQQVERGVIRLDDDVAKYVPEYSSRGNRVTIRQLLNHTSGIRDIGDAGDAHSRTLRVDVPQKDVLALIRNQPFNFEPGRNWSYNNTGYFLLGVILERVAGVPYADYILENVARPAGLLATTYCGRSLIQHRARGYDAVGSDFLNATYMSLNLRAAVGLCSTAGDLVTWARALQGGKVISRESYRLMTTPEGAAARAKPPYGFGLWIIEFGGRRYISHPGLVAGFNAVLSEVPSESVTIAIVSNTSGYGASTLGGQLGSAILGIPGPVLQKATRLEQPESKPLTRSQLRPYIGRYALREVRKDSLTSPDPVTMQVFDENGRLTAQLTGDPPETLTLVGDHEFVAKARPDMHFTFTVRQGQATHVTFVGPDGTYKGLRISDR